MTADPDPESKPALRARVLSARAAMDARARAAAGAAIVAHLLRQPTLSTARTVAAYVGFDTEIDTTPFLAAVLAQGRRLLLPRVVDVESKTRRHLVLHEVGDVDRETRPGRWGIREPDPALCAAIDPLEADLILVPGVAFDRRGGRLGYGAGFYDRLLSGLRPDCLRVAACFPVQLVPAVPLEAHDQRIQRLVTDRGEVFLTDE
ncbi:MAG: 5-formyltetrahydrofolate cyclo-ligase [bacterium]|jgi:5-formyltetrahydrofolate cyclo-ligase|nr:5-formyltetrahydrofolate cyclo-ligase [Betaproteobacteria bacterium]